MYRRSFADLDLERLLGLERIGEAAQLVDELRTRIRALDITVSARGHGAGGKGGGMFARNAGTGDPAGMSQGITCTASIATPSRRDFMPHASRSAFRPLLCLTALATLACAESTVAAPRSTSLGPNASLVSIVNDGAVAMSNTRVTTSERDVLPAIATLAPGATVGPYAVAVMHSYPMVQVVVSGRELIAHPVEGFTGFNPPRAPGSYVIRVRPGSEPGILDIRITPPSP